LRTVSENQLHPIELVWWFLKQSLQRGLAVDSWTLCVRGEVAASGG
jgi:hypothetical protein